MKTYILFIFGMFYNQEDIDYFCTQVLGDSPSFNSVRFVIEREQNIIMLFDSDNDKDKVIEEVQLLLIDDNIKFYFIFEKDDIITAHLPEEVKKFIFNPKIENMMVKLDYEKINKPLDLDIVLDKIKETGIDSLTLEEKNFLDNFENS
jgi:hypothetical protein